MRFAGELVPLAGLLELNQIKPLGCQTGAQSNFDPQRLSGAVSNRKSAATQQRSTRRKLIEGTQDGASPNQNQIYVLTSEPGDTDARCAA
jgi:hypothetical protein